MQVKSIIVVMLALFCVNATRCSNTSNNDGSSSGKLKLTPTWTKDTRISYYNGGGMMDQSTHIDIYTDSAIYIMHENQVDNKFKLKFSQNELDAIAKVFYDNNFTELKPTEHGIIYDAPSRSIMICKGAECCEKGNDATSSFQGSDGKTLMIVQNYVLEAVNKKMAEQQKNRIHIAFDKSLTGTKYDYSLQFAPSVAAFDSRKEGRLTDVDKEFPTGKYSLNVYTYIFNPNKGTKYGPNGYLQFSTTDCNTLTIGLTKDSLISILPSKK